MTDQDVLLDLLHTFAAALRRSIAGLSLPALSWQPDPDANNIAVTVWHISRALDLLTVRLLEQHRADHELWFTQGWAAATHYDPRGLGWSGFGNLSGYTREEVAAVPVLTAEQLLIYFDQAVDALSRHVLTMPPAQLQQVAGGWPQQPQPTTYEVIRNFLLDGVGHLGEVRAIHAMWQRRLPPNGANGV